MIEANESSPVYPELRGLLIKTLGPEPLLRSALADVDGIREAFIYGSWADPARRSPADIDVLVVGEPDVGVVYDAASAVETEVGRPVNITVRSPTEWDDRDGAFERAIRSGPRVRLI
jgi:predicted nucleotidyltransferase